MDRVSIYLNTMGRTEEQFRFYGSIFDTEPYAIMRMADIPGQEPLPDHEKDALIHIEVEILGGTVLMGTDLLASRGHRLEIGNNVAINLEPDSLDEGRRLEIRTQADEVCARLGRARIRQQPGAGPGVDRRHGG